MEQEVCPPVSNSFFSAALLAGGKSERMGFDKQLFHVQKDRLFASLLPALTSRFADVLVVTDKPELYGDMGVRAVRDAIPGFGPLSGIYTAVMESNSEYVYILACDMPSIDMLYIDYMIEQLTFAGNGTVLPPYDACITRKGDWIEPFHAFYGKGASDAMETALRAGDGSIYRLLQKINTLFIPETEARRFSPDWSLFRNINTSEEYAAHQKRDTII